MGCAAVAATHQGDHYLHIAFVFAQHNNPHIIQNANNVNAGMQKKSYEHHWLQTMLRIAMPTMYWIQLPMNSRWNVQQRMKMSRKPLPA